MPRGSKSLDKYTSMQRELIQQHRLYEDPEFPPDEQSLYNDTPYEVTLQWKRPWEIVRNPKFFIGGVNRFDVAQGRVSNCWFVSALADLAEYKDLFYQVCPFEQSFEPTSYCGMFRFNFWYFGEWKEVIIDDFLPTYNNRLHFTRSSDPNEFWSALLEKAYAKLWGSYEELSLGRISEALQDLTGGVIENINLRSSPPDLFNILSTAHARTSLMGCCIELDDENHYIDIGTINQTKTRKPLREKLWNFLCCHSVEGVSRSFRSPDRQQLPNGLIKGHAYSITGLAKFNIRSVRGRPEVELIRVRNPHGDKAEWKGAWSDRSKEWNMLSNQERKQLKLTFEDDGEFWMSMKDFVTNFTRLEICMLSPDSTTSSEKKSWEMRKETGKWQKGVTAGGCRNFIETFHTNPQFRVKLEDPDDSDEEGRCSFVVSLMRIERKRSTNVSERLPIGFAIYKIPENESFRERFERAFFEHNRAVFMTQSFTKLRDITCRCSLYPGEYVVVPSTFKAGQEADFLLRLFSEKPHQTSEIDEETTPVKPKTGKVKLTRTESEKIDKQFWSSFHQLAGEDKEVDQFELQHFLSEACKREVNGNPFSLDACRSMISMFDKDRSGALKYNEFRHLWTLLEHWKKHFYKYDKDNSGDMSTYELRDALKELGYQLSNSAISSIGLRYHNKQGTISFDMFVHIVVRVICMFEAFQNHVDSVKGRNEKAVFNIDDFIESTLVV